jgi:hypothetical protein
MGFKRRDGFVGSVPQKFIDNNMKKCPMCGTENPHWAVDEKMGFVKMNRFLFKCEQCDCILSATIADVTGYTRTLMTWEGLAKSLSGKKTKSVYFKVDEVGNMQTTQIYKDQEYPIEGLIEMADKIGV